MRPLRLAATPVTLVAGALACGSLASCTTKRPPPGEVMALVTTDLSVPKDIDALHVNLSIENGASLFDKAYPLQGPAPAYRLPGTIGVVSGPRTTEPVTIEVSGLLQGAVRVSRRAVVTLPTDRVAMVPIPLDWLCMGVECASGMTCQAGACVSDVDPTIPDYAPPPADDAGADGGSACFDTSACFASAVLWPAPLGADCTLPRPTGATEVHVALVVTGGAGICSPGSCLVPLDAESVEGWQTSADRTRIELPLAVCANGDVKAVEVSMACPTKRANVALCPGVGSPIAASDCTADADGGCPEGYVCDASGGRAQCIRIDDRTTDSGATTPPLCPPDPSVVCPGGATGYPCMPRDPSLQCGQVYASNCALPRWCCAPAEDAGSCALEASASGILIDDMSGRMNGVCGVSSHKFPIPAGEGVAGVWYTFGDPSGSMIPGEGAFTYTPVDTTATCEPPFSNAACMRSLTPYDVYAGMGFNFQVVTTLDGTRMPVPFPVTSYKGIRFWAKASDSGSRLLSVTFPDENNYAYYRGSACSQPGALLCGNYHQFTVQLSSTWQPYEVDFDSLSQRLTNADGFFTTEKLDKAGVMALEFDESFGPDGGPPDDAGVQMTFDVCVAAIYFVPN